MLTSSGEIHPSGEIRPLQKPFRHANQNVLHRHISDHILQLYNWVAVCNNSPDQKPKRNRHLKHDKLFGSISLGATCQDQVASALDDLTSALLFWRGADSTDMTVACLLPEAEQLAERSLAISRESMGVEHTMTAGREHNLGMVKRASGREHDALWDTQTQREMEPS